MMRESFEDITAGRQAWRRKMVADRAAMGEETRSALSARIVDHLAGFAIPRVVAFCWPVKYEPDVRERIRRWMAQGATAALPVVVADDAALVFRPWTPDVSLLPDRYGIPTPTGGDSVRPDLILLPLNGFDSAGYRLGYGGGYFDRTLAALEPRPLAVGVGFEINRLPDIQPEPHDQRLDWIVTEAGRFKI